MSLGELIIMNLEHQSQRVDVHMHVCQDILRETHSFKLVMLCTSLRQKPQSHETTVCNCVVRSVEPCYSPTHIFTCRLARCQKNRSPLIEKTVISGILPHGCENSKGVSRSQIHVAGSRNHSFRVGDTTDL